MKVWLYRILFLVIILVFQLTVSREIRSHLFETIISKNNTYSNYGYHERILPINIGKRVATLQVYFNESSKNVSVKLPFGMYFIFGILVMIMTGAKNTYYKYMVSVHAIIFLVLIPTIYAGLYFYPTLLLIVDFMSRYMIPLISLGIVAIQLANQHLITHAYQS